MMATHAIPSFHVTQPIAIHPVMKCTLIIIVILLPVCMLTLHLKCPVQELRNLLISEITPQLPNILFNVGNVNALMGLMKGFWPGLRLLIEKSCSRWTLELFQFLIKHTRHDPRIQSYLISPICLQKLAFDLPPLQPEDGYYGLPPRKLHSVKELVQVINQLHRVDPFGWYRAETLKLSLKSLLEKACQTNFIKLMKADLSSILLWIPKLSRISRPLSQGWLDFLSKRFSTTNDDCLRALIIFYYYRRYRAVPKRAFIAIRIKDHIKAWIKEENSNTNDKTRSNLLQYLAMDKKAKTCAELGLGENVEMEVFHLVIFLVLSQDHKSLLMDLASLLKKRLNHYTPLHLTNLLHYLYLGCLWGKRIDACRLEARALVGTEALRRIQEEVQLPTAWAFLYSVLTGPERIYNLHRWKSSAPNGEWRGVYCRDGDDNDKREEPSLSIKSIPFGLITCGIYNVPRNYPGSDFRADLIHVITWYFEKLKDYILVDKEKNEFSVYMPNSSKPQSDNERNESVEHLLFLTSYYRLHYSGKKEESSTEVWQFPILNPSLSRILIDEKLRNRQNYTRYNISPSFFSARLLRIIYGI